MKMDVDCNAMIGGNDDVIVKILEVSRELNEKQLESLIKSDFEKPDRLTFIGTKEITGNLCFAYALCPKCGEIMNQSTSHRSEKVSISFCCGSYHPKAKHAFIHSKAYSFCLPNANLIFLNTLLSEKGN